MMNQQRQSFDGRDASGRGKRGAVAVQVIVSFTALLGLAALGVDVGLLYSAKGELQRAADATALAAAWTLIDEDRLKGEAYQQTVFNASRTAAVEIALQNPILGSGAQVVPEEDVFFGRFDNWEDPNANIEYLESDLTNAVEVFVRRGESRGGSIALFFASIFGVAKRDLAVSSVAAFEDEIVGFKVISEEFLAPLLPFTLHVDCWQMLETKGVLGSCGAQEILDNFGYTKGNGVMGVPDQMYELNLYPGAGKNQLPPGNFGTVDIGSPSNSADDIARQILSGVSPEDMSYFPNNTIKLDEAGLLLNGDTGLSAGFKEELISIIGQPRVIPLFSHVEGPGENAEFTIERWVGIRIMYVNFQGSMNKKKLVIQPATVVTPTAVYEEWVDPSDYLYRPPRLIR